VLVYLLRPPQSLYALQVFELESTAKSPRTPGAGFTTNETQEVDSPEAVSSAAWIPEVQPGPGTGCT
jgi:hypothetical protein